MNKVNFHHNTHMTCVAQNENGDIGYFQPFNNEWTFHVFDPQEFSDLNGGRGLNSNELIQIAAKLNQMNEEGK